MSDDPQNQMRQWQQLKEQAVHGELQIIGAIGGALPQRCDTLLLELDVLKQQAGDLAYLSGYGGLPSALDLQNKFQAKASGGAPHDPNDSAVARLQQHIEVVKLMRDTYSAAIGQLQQTDQSAASRMNAHTEGVG
ncbi:hypothetical protein [Nocardia farcinica]|uniref:hypothetical protein n=1 Tax=Nocardia farcinica TaxID=37329 RepID=UPI002458FBD6|nr:hypothetical protein [Nocardia farcinica]